MFYNLRACKIKLASHTTTARLYQPSALRACPYRPDSIIGKKHVSPRLLVEPITTVQIYEQQYFPSKCNL